jgi:3-oxoacyl-[acyl-carrier protein] reductase
MDLGIEGKVALVSGASKGLGRGIAAALAAEGAVVAVASRSKERIDATASEIGAHGFVYDTDDVDGAGAVVHDVVDRLGPIDILVTNTGGPPPDVDPLGFSREQWEAAYRSLVLAPISLIEHVLPGMRERGWGRIVNVASISVREPISVLMLSNAHRSATLAAFKTIARDVARDGVTLNSLLPGMIATDRVAETAGSIENAQAGAREAVPVGRLGEVEEFAAAAAFLCSAQASYITGTALPVDGGRMQSV